MRSQHRSLFYAGGAALLLGLLTALGLASHLTAPIRATQRTVAALAAGTLDARVDVRGRDELAELARDVNRLGEALEQNANARRQWIADLAHELRTPLAILRGEIEALNDGVRAPTPAALRSLLDEAHQLGALIDDLHQLSLADLGALSYRFETIDVRALLAAVIDGHVAPAGIDVAIHADPAPQWIRADAVRVRQLFSNLLSNALRYTDSPGRIEWRLDSLTDGVRVTVDDSPPGVSRDALPQLFNRLYRVESSRNRADGGSGLGLAICRAIVDAHGGRIEALASPLGGLRVIVELQRA
jgi:two-component system, OmpR family, sensor histidine kinase BaeS